VITGMYYQQTNKTQRKRKSQVSIHQCWGQHPAAEESCCCPAVGLQTTSPSMPRSSCRSTSRPSLGVERVWRAGPRGS
jgi:hypothetical protein